jgi:hypothetical protein
VGMLYYQFECVLIRYVLKDIMCAKSGSKGMLLCLVTGGVGLPIFCTNIVCESFVNCS